MKYFIILLFISTNVLFAQSPVNISVSNLLRYGTGNVFEQGLKQKKEFFENLTDTRMSYNNFIIGFRLLHDSPPEFGSEFKGIQKRFVEFRKDNLYIRAGDSYSLFGRGLGLNLFEERNLVYDTGIDGLKMEYKTNFIKVSMTGGDVKHVDQIFLGNEESYKIRAGSVEITPMKYFSIGSNFVSGKIRFVNGLVDGDAAEFNMPEFFGSFRFSDFDLYASYLVNRVNPKATFLEPNPINHEGSGFYGSLSYTSENLGVSVEYKDYRFGITDPYIRLNPQRTNRVFAFQNPPIVHKEHNYTLLSRYPHVIDFNDEVGYQIDVFYTFLDNFTGSLNFASASRHDNYIYTGIRNTQTLAPIYKHDTRKNSFLPKMSPEYSPFWELYGDFQYYFGKHGSDYLLIGYNRRSDDKAQGWILRPDGKLVIESTRLSSIISSGQYSINKSWGLRFTIEQQWVYEDANLAQARFTNHLISLGIFQSPQFSLTARYEFTSDKATIDGRKDWTAIDFGFKISKSHNITITAGSDRGGKGCDNGVCKSIPPFSGIRGSIVSYF